MEDITAENKEIQENSINQETPNNLFSTTVPRAETPKEEPKSCKSQKKCCCKGKIIFYTLIVLAIAGLYVLHFTGIGTKTAPAYVVPEGTPGNGEILYVDLDSISEHYQLMDILTKDIEQEVQRQTAIFDNKEKAFQRKYNQFQQNYQSGILTDVQIQNAQQQLQEEYQRVMAEKEQVLTDLDNRQAAALLQVMDSLTSTAKRINAERHGASYILGYKAGTQIIYGDKTKDITKEVLDELNKNYTK